MTRTRFLARSLAVAVAVGLAAAAQAQTTIPAAPLSLGPIPDDGPCLLTTSNPHVRDVMFPVSGLGAPTDVRVTFATTLHELTRDVTAILIAPSGATHLLFAWTGLTFGNGVGSTSTLMGPYTFSDTAFGGWWLTAAYVGSGGLMPSAAYRTSQAGGGASTGAGTFMNPVFAGHDPNGNWTLRLIDQCRFNSASVISASLTLTTPASSSGADAFSTDFGTPIAVAAPGVLANDTVPPFAAAPAAVMVSAPAHGTVTLAPDGAFVYAPRSDYAGADSFTYRAVSGGVLGNVATVSITVRAPTAALPPAQLRVDTVDGNFVRLRWNPPAVGPPPSGYLIEGGFLPGAPVAVLPIAGTDPVVTLSVGNGSYFVRVRSLDGATPSAPSNEVPLLVGVAAPPSAPEALTGLGLGSALYLSWRNSFGGGQATGLILDVSGSAVASVPLAVSETFAFSPLPGGTYTFRIRASNAGGTSAPSAPVTISLPASCSGGPALPANFLAYRQGTALTMLWDPPPSGSAPTAYLVRVAGAFTGDVPLAARSVSGAVAPGTYVLSVAAVNACGTSAFTAPQTVVMP